jgi:hypothetical protein
MCQSVLYGIVSFVFAKFAARFIMKLVLFFLLFFVASVHANSCWNAGGGGTQTINVTLGTTTVQRDAPVGSVIATQTVGSTITNTINCDYSGNYYLTYGMLYNGGIPVGNNVYKTNVEGVGLRLSSSSRYYSNPPSQFPITQVSGLTSFPATIEFVKTGDITSGTMNLGVIGNYYITENALVLGTMTTVAMGAGNIVTQAACSVTTGAMNFSMGDIPVTSFSNAIGFTPDKTVTQNLGINCDPNANINITLVGTKNPDVSDTNVLALSNQGQSGVADGIGVQLLYNNNPLVLNTILNLKKSAGGQETFPITARYIQTKANVKPGSGNATATLNLTYQ